MYKYICNDATTPNPFRDYMGETSINIITLKEGSAGS